MPSFSISDITFPPPSSFVISRMIDDFTEEDKHALRVLPYSCVSPLLFDGNKAKEIYPEFESIIDSYMPSKFQFYFHAVSDGHRYAFEKLRPYFRADMPSYSKQDLNAIVRKSFETSNFVHEVLYDVGGLKSHVRNLSRRLQRRLLAAAYRSQDRDVIEIAKSEMECEVGAALLGAVRSHSPEWVHEVANEYSIHENGARIGRCIANPNSYRLSPSEVVRYIPDPIDFICLEGTIEDIRTINRSYPTLRDSLAGRLIAHGRVKILYALRNELTILKRFFRPACRNARQVRDLYYELFPGSTPDLSYVNTYLMQDALHAGAKVTKEHIEWAASLSELELLLSYYKDEMPDRLRPHSNPLNWLRYCPMIKSH